MANHSLPEFDKLTTCGTCLYEWTENGWVEVVGESHCGPECSCQPPPSSTILNAAPSLKAGNQSIEVGDTIEWGCANNLQVQRDLVIELYLETLAKPNLPTNPLLLPMVMLGVAAMGLAAALAWVLLAR